MKPWQPDKGLRRCSACGAWSRSAPSLCCAAPCHPGPQAAFLGTYANVHEVLNAGSVGSGKTDAGIMAPVVYPEYRRDPTFTGLILRHQEKDLLKDITPRIERPSMYAAYAGGGPLNQTSMIYRLKSRGSVVFGHAKNLLALQGQEYQYIWWDELTHWATPEAYLYVSFTRMRSSTGLPIRLRAGTNARGPGKRWVKARWGPWLDPRYLDPPKSAPAEVHRGAAQLRALGYAPRPGRPPLDSGQVLHYLVNDSFEEQWVAPGTPNTLTRTCLRTRTEDNPALAESDPQYAKTRLRVAGALLYHQLGGDDWEAEDEEGGIFLRDFFPRFDPDSEKMPRLVGEVSRWDFAWTKRQKSDWSTRVKLGWTSDGHFYVLDVIRVKGTPDEIKRLVRETAQKDGRHVPQIVPLNFSDSLYVLNDLTRELAGYQVYGQKEVGAKEVRIATLQPQAQQRRLHLVAGPWIETFLDEAVAYKGDGVRHDDQLDALAGAFLWIVDSQRPGLTAAQAQAVDDFVDAFTGHMEQVPARVVGAQRLGAQQQPYGLLSGRCDDDDDEGGGGFGPGGYGSLI